MIDTPNAAWQQAQLSLCRGGLGLSSLAKHSSSAYISSLSASSICSTCKHLMHLSNNLANLSLLMIHYCWTILMLCSILSGKIEDHHLGQLLDKASLPGKARLLSVLSPRTAAWLTVIPSIGLNLHLEFQTAVKWWLGISVTDNTLCPFCPPHALDPLG